MSTIISSKVYNLVRRRLVTGELRVGMRVSEFSLAKELKVSRSPIREALSRLVSDGLLEKYDGLGTFVKIPTRREIDELFVIRELLETHAVKQAVKKNTPHEVSHLRKISKAARCLVSGFGKSEPDGDSLFVKFIELDLEFHMAILKIAGNNQLIKMVENCRILSGIFNLYDISSIDFAQLQSICKEHDRIVDSIAKRDIKEADKWIKKQIVRSRSITMSSFEKLAENNRFVNRSSAGVE